mgnify:CR=1 FL=1
MKVRKVGQALAAAVLIVGVSSVAGAGAGSNGRGDQSVCGGQSQETFSCLDKYEKDGVEVYCVTAGMKAGSTDGGNSVALSCDWEHAKHPDNK